MRESSLRKASWLVAAPIVAVLAGCGGAAEREPGAMRTTTISTDCLNVSLARDFRYLDDHNLIVYAPGRQGYHLELARTCFGLRNQTRLALRSRSDRLCGFAGDAVIVDGGFPESCSVLSVRRLDEAALEALIAQFETGQAPSDAFEVEVVESPDDDAEEGAEESNASGADESDAPSD